MMFPSSNSNRHTSFSSSNQPIRTSFCNYSHGNHSKHSQDHDDYRPSFSSSTHLYRPHYISLEHEPVIHDYSVIAGHEPSACETTNLQSTMEKCNYNNGKYVTASGGDQLNSHVTFENNCRGSRKDRHSKINTAQGPRDRRMRLSLDVAKKFFRLQDMLGFDKASNTIAWLLKKSKPAIQDLLPQEVIQTCSLMGVSNSASSASECEVMSGIDDQSVEKTGKSRSCKEKKKVDRGCRKSAYIDQAFAKETREQARARARMRTAQKRNKNAGVSGLDQNVDQLGSWIPFGENQVQEAEYVYKQQDNSSNSWSPSLLFSSHYNPGSSHELNEFQILGKPWEGNNN